MKKPTDSIVIRFMERHPELTIDRKVEAAAEPIEFPVRRKHAKGARVDECFDCTLARAGHDIPGVIDAAIQLTTAHLLYATGPTTAKIIKYNVPQSSRGMIEANDAGIEIWGQVMRLVPPRPTQMPGIQTKTRAAGRRRGGKQTAEQVAKRVASRKKSMGRRLLSNAS